MRLQFWRDRRHHSVGLLARTPQRGFEKSPAVRLKIASTNLPAGLACERSR
jgi:hypothetical protein